MLLCVDIGNTNIKLGLFEGENMQAHWRIATERSSMPDEYAVLLTSLLDGRGYTLNDIDGCAVSSVVPSLTETFGELCQNYFEVAPVILNAETDTGMAIRTDYPAEVGPDLLVNALAGKHLYGTPLIVIGFGTATTFGAVSRQGDFEGVAIAPGIISSGEALFRSTAALPRVALSRPPHAIGKNTIRSLQAGLVFGFAGLVEKLVGRIQEELGGDAKVIATGGLAGLIAPETGVIDAVEPHLALVGLRLLYERVRGRG